MVVQLSGRSGDKSKHEKFHCRARCDRIGLTFIVSKLDQQVLTIQQVHHRSDAAAPNPRFGPIHKQGNLVPQSGRPICCVPASL